MFALIQGHIQSTSNQIIHLGTIPGNAWSFGY